VKVTARQLMIYFMFPRVVIYGLCNFRSCYFGSSKYE